MCQLIDGRYLKFTIVSELISWLFTMKLCSCRLYQLMLSAVHVAYLLEKKEEFIYVCQRLVSVCSYHVTRLVLSQFVPCKVFVHNTYNMECL